MQLKVTSIKENENGIYTINFERMEEEDKIKNWTTFKKTKDGYKLSGNIYVKNKLKRTAYEMYHTSLGIKKFPDPELHYDSELTSEVLTSLYNEEEFQKFIKEKGIVFNENDLFFKGSVKREENLIKLIKTAFERDEYILAIFDSGEAYVPLNDENCIGWYLYDDIEELEKIELEGLNKKEKEELTNNLQNLIKKLRLSTKTEYIIKYETSGYYFVDTFGKENYGIDPFGWELPEDTVYFDEIFYLDTISRLAKEVLKRYDVKGPVFNDETNEIEFIKQSEYELFCDGYIMDTVLYDNENVFEDVQYDFKYKQNGYINKINEILKKLN
jgi:hypothetical protein